jgi:hypothetical protein
MTNNTNIPNWLVTAFMILTAIADIMIISFDLHKW